MHRLYFLGALFGFGAVAQTLNHIERSTITKPRWITGTVPTKDQCPVCGTMAKPFLNPKNCLGWSYQPIGCAQNERITRCTRCNAAFWQDSE